MSPPSVLLSGTMNLNASPKPAALLYSLHNAPKRAKTIHFIRHAQGTHNVNKEYRNPGHVDAQLTPLGIEQCRDLATSVARNLPVECIITSPLSRTIQTAHHCFDYHLSKRDGQDDLPFIACEHWRETVNYLCDMRSKTSVLQEKFPAVNFDHIQHEHDPVWEFYEAKYGTQQDHKKGRESVDFVSLEKRARAAWKFIQDRPEKEIAIVSHAAILMHNFNTFADNVVQYQDEEVETLMKAGFQNCEIRSVGFVPASYEF